MKRLMTQVLAAVALVGLCGVSTTFAADKMSTKAKEANKAHSEAPAALPEGGAATGTAASGAMATGEGMQGMMSPEMTKFITEMKVCHKNGKNDMKCHDGVMKKCEAKMTKDECGKVMAAIHSEKAGKM
ncbi:hypothetical protein BH10BDE1_BH10BDE1_13560 [soil metagenome]